MARHVLITGASGQLGQALQNCVWPENVCPVFLTRHQLNLNDLGAISSIIGDAADIGPFSAVINAAAYTAVDLAERAQTEAWRINAMAPAAMAEACAVAGIPLIHISTDYVFSGEMGKAWEANDIPCPVNVYGASKLGGEIAIRASGSRYAIVRTAWIFSAFGNNFVKTMLRLGAGRDQLDVVDDQFGSPTSASDLADIVKTIALQMMQNEAIPSGVFHFSNSGVTSWAGFAAEIFQQASMRGGSWANVKPILSGDYPTAARRPANSVLSHRAIIGAYDVSPRPWPDALAETLDELIGSQNETGGSL